MRLVNGVGSERTAVELARPGDPDSGIDPTVGGARVVVFASGTSAGKTYVLPASEWRKVGPRRYRYRNVAGTVTARLHNGRFARFAATGADAYAFSGAQGSVTAIFEAGGSRFCSTFGGTLQHDDGTRFVATDAPAPADCVVPDGGCVEASDCPSSACGTPTCTGFACGLSAVAQGDVCRPAVDACDRAEVCDGTSTDCPADGGNEGGGAACSTGKPGVCADGTTVCASGQVTCSPNTAATTEVCGDTLDNDCDGTVDNGCCVATTCQAEGVTCGSISDGCGQTLECGTCSGTDLCEAGTCAPYTLVQTYSNSCYPFYYLKLLTVPASITSYEANRDYCATQCAAAANCKQIFVTYTNPTDKSGPRHCLTGDGAGSGTMKGWSGSDTQCSLPSGYAPYGEWYNRVLP